VSPDLALVAGETSGDMLAAHVIAALKTKPVMAGIAGPRMHAQGVEAWWPSERLAVRGYVEVLGSLAGILKIRRQLAARLLDAPPKLFVGVDAPDFNLKLEEQLKSSGIKTVHFISPSIWAWRAERITQIKRAVDLMLCVFPFEKAIYDQAGMSARYVGHPLADHIPLADERSRARAELGYTESDEIVALLPGSRVAEIEHLLPAFLEAARLLRKAKPKLRFVLPIAHQALRQKIAASAGIEDLRLLDGQSHAALAACNATLIASGTATLEAVLFKRPMVIAYRMPRLSWHLTQKKRLQPWVGLPNILAQDFLVPELLQDACTPQALAAAVLTQLEDGTASRIEARFASMHSELRQGCAAQAARAWEEFL
jgi:lipid-A-disaccharide synthase